MVLDETLGQCISNVSKELGNTTHWKYNPLREKYGSPGLYQGKNVFQNYPWNLFYDLGKSSCGCGGRWDRSSLRHLKALFTVLILRIWKLGEMFFSELFLNHNMT